jgi:tetratricopeptide (TPR) repeat protein
MERCLRSSTATVIFCIIIAVTDGAVARTSECTVAGFKSDAPTTFKACTELLETHLEAQQKSQALKIRGRAAHRLELLDVAIADYDAALKLTPNDPELHIRRGWTHYDKYELGFVLERAAHALTLDPKEGDAYDLIGAAMTRLGDLDRARAAYDAALRLRPNSPIIRFHRYQLFNSLGRLAEAIAELDAILGLPAADTRDLGLKHLDRRVTFRTGARLHRAMTLNGMGRREEAGTEYNFLVAENPSAVTFMARAAHLAQAPDHPAAQADIERAVADDPNYWAPYDLRARLHFYAKRYVASSEEFKHAIKLAPHRGALRWWRSQALRKLERLDEATTDALSALEVDPNFVINDKLKTLHERGYLQLSALNSDPMPALGDAIRACMLDERCW